MNLYTLYFLSQNRYSTELNFLNQSYYFLKIHFCFYSKFRFISNLFFISNQTFNREQYIKFLSQSYYSLKILLAFSPKINLFLKQSYTVSQIYLRLLFRILFIFKTFEFLLNIATIVLTNIRIYFQQQILVKVTSKYF